MYIYVSLARRYLRCTQVVLTGAKTEDHLNEALPHLLPILEQYKQRERTTNNTGQAMS